MEAKYGWNQTKLLRSLLGGIFKALDVSGRGEDEEEDGNDCDGQAGGVFEWQEIMGGGDVEEIDDLVEEEPLSFFDVKRTSSSGV